MLGDLLERSLRDDTLPLAEVPARFTAARWKDARALQKMDRMFIATGWPELQPRPSRIEKVASQLIIRNMMSLFSALSRRFPKFAQSPFDRLLQDPSFGYAACLAQLRAAAAVCYGALAVIVVGATMMAGRGLLA